MGKDRERGHDQDRHTRFARADTAGQAARRGTTGRKSGLRGGNVLGSLLALEQAAKPLRLRLGVARGGVAGHVAAVRGCQRSGAALPPGDHRASRGHAGDHVPEQVLDRGRHRRELQRAHHRRPLAPQGGEKQTAPGERGRDAPPLRRRGGQPQRARHGGPRPPLRRNPREPATHRRRGGEHRHRPLGRRVGRRAHHHQPAAREAGRDDLRLPRGRR